MKRFLVSLALLLLASSAFGAEPAAIGRTASPYQQGGTIYAVDAAARTMVIDDVQYSVAFGAPVHESNSGVGTIYALKSGMRIGFNLKQTGSSKTPTIKEIWVLSRDMPILPLPPTSR